MSQASLSVLEPERVYLETGLVSALILLSFGPSGPERASNSQSGFPDCSSRNFLTEDSYSGPTLMAWIVSSFLVVCP